MRKRIFVLVFAFILCFATLSQALATHDLYDTYKSEWEGMPLQKQSSYERKPTKAIQTILYYYTSTTRTLINEGGGIDGAFGSKTAEAVESFQRVHDLSMVDGKVGTGTWRTLYKVLEHSAAGAGGNAWNTSTAYLFSRTYSGEGRVMIIKRARANGAWYINSTNQIFYEA